ncbi:hypothetical protein P7K49_000235 [Saguinus oedipus]|uniref:UBA domain-containing protein n=1 Tax=Saguinus oedipus TaxID=9490 RepID=A0ABQ9WB37_SAGOE|nr:hypothetical protein P7K49_000235 [Saguinus oedipus]
MAAHERQNTWVAAFSAAWQQGQSTQPQLMFWKMPLSPLMGKLESFCLSYMLSTSPRQLSVARLMEMGFSRGDALEALRASNNDLNVATNFLLQH